MNIQQEILRIQASRDKIRNKLTELGLATSTDKLDTLANTVDGIVDNGGVDVEVKEGETYKIPKGYHNGSGTVSGVAGGGNYTLQSKTVTPTKAQQNIVADAGKYGLSSVTVEAIPENYQDVSSVDATAADVLANKKIVTKDGTLVAGTMPNNGAVAATLTPTNYDYTVPAGYHNGTGEVRVAIEEKVFTPTKEAQTHTATTKFVNKVIINPIPDAYQDVTEVDATANKVLVGSKFVDAAGNVVEGTMSMHSGDEVTLDTIKTSHVLDSGYYEDYHVGITLEEKTVTPAVTQQTITPSAGKVLSKVTVAPIPDKYQDVSEVDAAADQVLEDFTIVDAEGNVIMGTMPNIGAFEHTIDLENPSISIPKGYHDGDGCIDLIAEEKSATPTKSAQTITPSTGKVLSKVTVTAIPATYQDITVTTADASHVLDGKFFVNNVGVKTEGTMVNNGDVSASMDGLTVTSVTIPAGYTTGGTISLTDDIEAALAAI